jgi:hypothetical protein
MSNTQTEDFLEIALAEPCLGRLILLDFSDFGRLSSLQDREYP